MDREKMLSIVESYVAKLQSENVPVQRANTKTKLHYLTIHERKMHSHYLCTNIVQFLKDKDSQEMWEKALVYFGALQMFLGFAGLYCIDDVRGHNSS